MKRLLIPAVALFAASCGVTELEVVQPSDHAGAFNVLDVTGPNKGKTLCYR